jgi:hypothetical protein
MPRKTKNPDELKVKLSATVNPKIKAEFERFANHYGRNTSQWLEIAMAHYNDYCRTSPLTSRALFTNASQTPKL